MSSSPLRCLLLAVLLIVASFAPSLTGAMRSDKLKALSKSKTNAKLHRKPILPPSLRWAELVQAVSEAGCVTTDCTTLSHFYDPKVGRCFHYHRHESPSPTVVSPTGASAAGHHDRLCCRPLAVIATRTEDCPSCQEVWGALRTTHAAELDLLSEYVTFVDGGDPMMDSVLRHPYPLPLPFTLAQLAAMEMWPLDKDGSDSDLREDADNVEKGKRERLSAKTPRLLLSVANSSRALADGLAAPNAIAEYTTRREEEATARRALSSEAREELLAHETALRRRAAHLAAHPPRLSTHQWAPHVRRAMAGQGDYVFRAVFLFPHNGSVMRDGINENLSLGIDSHVHFYSSVGALASSVRRAVRVLDDALAHEAMAHCS